MEIRKIHPGEIDDLLSIIHQYVEEAAETMPEIAGEISDQVIVENIRKWSIQHTHNLLVAFDGYRPVGFIAGFLVQMPWGSSLQANINFIFLSETYRNMDNFRNLLRSFEDWARQAGATKIFSGDIGIDIERSKKLYAYLDFKEGLYVFKDIANA
jgi:GNAT superfamily N-acetyltransferase